MSACLRITKNNDQCFVKAKQTYLPIEPYQSNTDCFKIGPPDYNSFIGPESGISLLMSIRLIFYFSGILLLEGTKILLYISNGGKLMTFLFIIREPSRF